MLYNKSRNILILLFIMFSFACEDNNWTPPDPIDGGQDSNNDVEQDHFNPPDIEDADPDGPSIEITTPIENETISGDFLKVKAIITSQSSSVDYENVELTIEGETYSMTADTQTENGFEVTVDLNNIPDGSTVIRIMAKDVEGRTSYADRVFNMDKGPAFTIYSPNDGKSYHGGMNVSFLVSDNDGVDENTVTLKVGYIQIPLVKEEESSDTANGSPVSIRFSTSILFDDTVFSPPLDGQQRLVFYAENMLGNSSETYLDFVVDNDGPTINITSHEPGQIIGSIIEIKAEITDEAGILPSSVYAIIGNNDVNYQISLQKEEGSTQYKGSFDTKILPHNFVWPALQVFASDNLGNESSVGFQLALDNTPPILSLDPPEDFRIAKENSDNLLSCSKVFDPVGNNNPNDKTIVPQVFWLRARIEDFGNEAPGAVWSPLALIKQSEVELYILDDTSQPLVVDTDNDGVCDNINPELVPSIHLSGDPKETLKLEMDPINPSGSANFTFETGPFDPPCEISGDDADPPDDICPAVIGDMSIALWYTYDHTEPSIYSLPPIVSGNSLKCTGIQFDARANNLTEGWVCIAVKAIDNVGNVGVSAPLRVCLDFDPNDGNIPLACQTLSNAPDCSGTLDTSAATPIVTSIPCSSLEFPQGEIRRDDL